MKGGNSVKVSGNDLETLSKLGEQIKNVLATVPGIEDLGVSASLGQPTIRIDIDRAKAARYGLAPGDINATVQAAIGGQAAGDVYENGSDRHFPMVVRLAPRYRENLEAIKRIPIGAQTDKGVTQVPLSEVANVALVSGAFYIYREQQARYVPVKFSVRGRDLGSAVLEAQQRVADAIRRWCLCRPVHGTNLGIEKRVAGAHAKPARALPRAADFEPTRPRVGHDPRQLRLRDHRHAGQDRRVHRIDAALRARRGQPHRRGGDLARRRADVNDGQAVAAGRREASGHRTH